MNLRYTHHSGLEGTAMPRTLLASLLVVACLTAEAAETVKVAEEIFQTLPQ
jgi:hypothetical protein